MRARQPDRTGYAVNAGVRLYYEVHGSGPLRVLLVPPWAIVSGEFWKMQLPFLARHYTAVVYDPRGNGHSDRPVSGYTVDNWVGDAVEVLDDLSIDRCALVTVSAGIRTCCVLAARCPERISAIATISGSFYNWTLSPDERTARLRKLREHFDDWVRGFWAGHFPEPHATKAQDDGWEWAHGTTAPILMESYEELWRSDVREVLAQIRCPVLQIHGLQEADHTKAFEARRLLSHSTLVTMITPGHLPNVRDPVRVNLLLREFLDRHAAERPPSVPERVGR